MLLDTLLYLAALLTLIAIAGGFAYPATRPYVKRYVWILVGFVVLALAGVFLRRRPGRSARKPNPSLTNLTVFDKVMEHAEEQALLEEAKFQQRSLDASTQRVAYENKVDAIKLIDDSLARRQALIKLVESK